MPAKSKAQANLMRAAEHGATFGKAKQIRASMTPDQMHDYAVTPSKNLPRHVPKGNRYARIGKPR